MAENAINQVRAAERKAEETLRAAAQESVRIVDEAETQAVKLANDAEDAAKTKAAAQVAGAHEASRQELEAALATLDGEMKNLADTARSRQGAAIKQVLEALA